MEVAHLQLHGARGACGAAELEPVEPAAPGGAAELESADVSHRGRFTPRNISSVSQNSLC